MTDQDGFLDWFRNAAPYFNAHRGRVIVIHFSGELLASDGLADLIHDLALLHALGLRLVLLSNTSITHLRFIQKNFNILSRFDAFTTSCEVGVQKPGSAIYEDALTKANCGPENCFYTDDIEDYVLRARTFGIHAEVYTQTAGTRKSLRDLGVRVNSQ